METVNNKTDLEKLENDKSKLMKNPKSLISIRGLKNLFNSMLSGPSEI